MSQEATVMTKANSGPSLDKSFLARGLWSRTGVVALLLFCIGLAAVGQAMRKSFWYDELVTLRVASLPSAASIWSFYEHGLDTTSPFPAILVHAFQALPGMPEIKARLPFTAAFIFACACVYAFVRKRYPGGYALAAMLLLAVGNSSYFASEARAYAFMLAGAAFGAVCWQRAHNGSRRSTLATWGVFCGLSIAILFHFFAVFLVVPFLFAQWMHERATGEREWRLWLAILLYPASVLLMARSILAAHHVYGGTFWSKPKFFSVVEAYLDFITPIWKEIFLLIAILTWFAVRARGAERADVNAPEPQPGGQGFTRGEWALSIALALLPFISFIGSHLLGAFRAQYALPMHLGMSFLFGAAAGEACRRSRSAEFGLGAAFVVLFLIAWKTQIVSAMRAIVTRRASPPVVLEYGPEWLNYCLSTGLPIVAEGADSFMALSYYGPPELQSRLTYLTDHARALQWPESMTNELNLESFGHVLGLRVENYDDFTRAHPEFLVVGDPSQYRYDWLLKSLLKQSETTHDAHVQFAWKYGIFPFGEEVYRIRLGPPQR